MIVTMILPTDRGVEVSLAGEPADLERHLYLRVGHEEVAFWGTAAQRLDILRQWAAAEGCILIEEPARVPVSALTQVAPEEDVARIAAEVAP
ncbi:MAG: hypothetical protein ACP5QO_16940 [Clostridia bacterium]